MTEAVAPGRLSRRALLGAFGAGAIGAAGVTAAATAVAVGRVDEAAPDSLRHDFHGAHQAGITTPMQAHLHTVALDATTSSRTQLAALLRGWSAAAAAMTAGRAVGRFGALSGPYDAPPDDTGEAVDLSAAGLTVTVGFGPGLFRDPDGRDRFGLARHQPDGLRDLPAFPGDALEPARCGGDLVVQACADDAQVVVHAVRTLVRAAFGTAAVRWAQTGFVPRGAPGSPTPRNLFGFKDGTANISAEDAPALDRWVWVQAGDGPDWLEGGTFLAARRIRMTIETWDRTSMREQEAVVGRTKSAGAPLSGGGEFDQPDLAAVGGDGRPLVPVDSHLALAHPSRHDGVRILRRGYNYADGSDALGRLDAGLFFVSFQRDLQSQFVPLQLALSRSDRMNEYLRYTSSAVFALPPGVPGPDGYLGQRLLEA